ncbi:MaoC family dehydratase [Sulfuritalea sp.]|uniref:MaoC family dehydratase n=1 Tax=Sulfuritalea sp. TaxID=2480090 RepID=UPI001AC0B0A5|nr:MaoC family dehydratase [Sulfuritalea sp.]MBN8477060.1 MaoC family dehydratase [Sulfuritalea sp.]
MSVRLDYRSKPGFLGFMAQMWRPKRRFDAGAGLPDIVATWRGQRYSPRELADFFTLSGLPAGADLSILHPHTASFPMLMAMLSHPAFPLPIWRVLQVRNRMTQHEAIAPDAALDLTVRTGELRVLDKGIEMDLCVSAEANGRVAFEAVNTFYSRGRFGAAQAEAPPNPVPDGGPVAEWQMPAHGRLGYSRLSGDFNPLHLHDGYARRQGFARAFAHPQRAIGQCLAHLGAARHAAMRLETWIKGPVFYGAKLALRAETRPGSGVFALHVDGDERPAIVGRYEVFDKDST